jgi:hypothetical protein
VRLTEQYREELAKNDEKSQKRTKSSLFITHHFLMTQMMNCYSSATRKSRSSIAARRAAHPSNFKNLDPKKVGHSRLGIEVVVGYTLTFAHFVANTSFIADTSLKMSVKNIHWLVHFTWMFHWISKNVFKRNNCMCCQTNNIYSVQYFRDNRRSSNFESRHHHYCYMC